MIKDKIKKKKVNAPSNKNKTNQKKGRAVSHNTKTKTTKKKTSTTDEWKWEHKKKPTTKNECTLEAQVLVDLDHGSTPFNTFQTVTGLNELLEIIVTETNRYAIQKGHNFESTKDEMKAFLGINVLYGYQ